MVYFDFQNFVKNLTTYIMENLKNKKVWPVSFDNKLKALSR
jgi:hypothetical protein